MGDVLGDIFDQEKDYDFVFEDLRDSKENTSVNKRKLEKVAPRFASNQQKNNSSLSIRDNQMKRNQIPLTVKKQISHPRKSAINPPSRVFRSEANTNPPIPYNNNAYQKNNRFNSSVTRVPFRQRNPETQVHPVKQYENQKRPRPPHYQQDTYQENPYPYKKPRYENTKQIPKASFIPSRFTRSTGTTKQVYSHRQNDPEEITEDLSKVNQNSSISPKPRSSSPSNSRSRSHSRSRSRSFSRSRSPSLSRSRSRSRSRSPSSIRRSPPRSPSPEKDSQDIIVSSQEVSSIAYFSPHSSPRREDNTANSKDNNILDEEKQRIEDWIRDNKDSSEYSYYDMSKIPQYQDIITITKEGLHIIGLSKLLVSNEDKIPSFEEFYGSSQDIPVSPRNGSDAYDPTHPEIDYNPIPPPMNLYPFSFQDNDLPQLGSSYFVDNEKLRQIMSSVNHLSSSTSSFSSSHHIVDYHQNCKCLEANVWVQARGARYSIQCSTLCRFPRFRRIIRETRCEEIGKPTFFIDVPLNPNTLMVILDSAVSNRLVPSGELSDLLLIKDLLLLGTPKSTLWNLYSTKHALPCVTMDIPLFISGLRRAQMEGRTILTTVQLEDSFFKDAVAIEIDFFNHSNFFFRGEIYIGDTSDQRDYKLKKKISIKETGTIQSPSSFKTRFEYNHNEFMKNVMESNNLSLIPSAGYPQPILCLSLYPVENKILRASSIHTSLNNESDIISTLKNLHYDGLSLESSTTNSISNGIEEDFRNCRMSLTAVLPRV